MIEVSVVIPTYNMGRLLDGSLRAIAASDMDHSRYEVIVVDDASTDSTPEIVKGCATLFKNFRYVRRAREAAHGPGIARGEGDTLACSDIIACTDADCRVEPQWLATLVRAIATEGSPLVGGETYSDRPLIFPWRFAPAGHRHINANLGYRKSTLRGITYDTDFQGHVGSDTDFVQRLIRAGIPYRHVPAMRVFHPAQDRSLRESFRRSYARANEVLMHKKHGEIALMSMHAAFRPTLLGRVSPVSAAILGGIVGIVVLFLALPPLSAVLSVASVVIMGSLWFLINGYRACVWYRPQGNGERISWSHRLKTLGFLITYLPTFVVARVVGSARFGHFLL